MQKKFNVLVLLSAVVLMGQGCFQPTENPTPTNNGTPPPSIDPAPPSSGGTGGSPQDGAPVTEYEDDLSNPSQGY